MSGGLLQISEPGESSIKEACAGRVVGIDLGTTNSLVATVMEGDPLCLSVDDEGRKLLPSVVEYGEGGTIVGRLAAEHASARPRDVIVSVKRFMGRGPEDPELGRHFMPYRFASKTGPVVRFRVGDGDNGTSTGGGREVTPVEVSSEILRALRLRAEEVLGGELDGVVITVPAYFDDAQRQATKDAGRVAGLEVLRLLNEPTAAALAYGLDKRAHGTFAVYDLGGGTFDISILKLSDGVFEVKSTGGDTSLGGDDFDRALADLVVGRLELRAEDLSPSEQRGLLDNTRLAKHALTDGETASITFRGQTLEVTRAQFDEAIAPVLVRTGAPCRRALKDADLTADELDGVILVGGATRTPAVRKYVAKLFKNEPLADIDPDQVVALGAAIQADLLGGAGPRDDVLLLDVIPLSLGLEMMGGVVEKVIHRNSTIPTGAKQTFTTYAENQTGFDIHVLQGERETVDACRSLARFQLKGIPPMPAGMARLEVTFEVDADGILHVSAREETTGNESSIEVKPSYGLTDEQVEKMLLESYEFAEDDVKAKLVLEARVEADRILDATRVALERDAQLVPEGERPAIEAAMGALVEARDGSDHRAINRAVEALDHASKGFAEARMNRSMSQAMTGRSIGEVEEKLR